MAVISKLGVRARADLAVGELIRYRHGQINSYGIVVGRLPNGATTVVVLSEQLRGGHVARLVDIQLDAFVVTLGRSWEVEVIDGPECYIRNNNYNERVGAISIDADGAFLRAHSGNHFDGALLNLATFQLANEDHYDSVAAPTWRLWANEEQRKDTASEPLLVIDLTIPIVED